MQTFLSLF